LTGRYEDDAVDRVAKAADDAIGAGDSDELEDALARFLHVAETSPAFGFDLLGFAFDSAGADPRPMFLEVKSVPRNLGSTADRVIHVSAHEWREAQRLGDEYAFLLVRHDPTGSPQSLEVVADPSSLIEPDGILRIDPEQFAVTIPAAATG
jgi:hypothetical protein